MANLVVKEEPGGDERVGEDSQDESTTGSTVAPRLNPVVPDEDTVASSLDGHESPTPPELSASAFSIDSECSNSSVDIPLLPRPEPAGTKRKAEVLSKESGKIGVTITTSSPSSASGSPPPNKIPRLLPIKGTNPSAVSPPYLNVSSIIKSSSLSIGVIPTNGNFFGLFGPRIENYGNSLLLKMHSQLSNCSVYLLSNGTIVAGSS